MDWYKIMAMKKSNIAASLIIGILIIIVSGLFYKNYRQKDILFDSTFNIYKLTDKEYEDVGTSDLENPNKGDFRKAVLRVVLQHTERNREVIVPTVAELKTAINSYDMVRYWFGDYYEKDNESEDAAEYMYEFVFYSKDLNDHELKSLFGDLKISAVWTDMDGNMQKETYLLSDIISFR